MIDNNAFADLDLPDADERLEAAKKFMQIDNNGDFATFYQGYKAGREAYYESINVRIIKDPERHLETEAGIELHNLLGKIDTSWVFARDEIEYCGIESKNLLRYFKGIRDETKKAIEILEKTGKDQGQNSNV